MIRFIPVSELTDPLTITLGLSGASGTGKTYTALSIARGIAHQKTGRPDSRIGIVDTENRRALHYAKSFPEMAHFDMRVEERDGKVVGFTPERWIEVIDAAEKADVAVLIIDSFSHAWEGVDGVLDLQARKLAELVDAAEAKAQGRYAVDPAKLSEQAWIEPKLRYRRLIDRIVRAKCDMIICTRAKPVRQQGFGATAKNARPTKTRRDDVPWDPAADRDLMFEMTGMIILDPSAPGCPVHQIKVPDQLKGLFDPHRQMGENLGMQLAKWAKDQGTGLDEKRIYDQARSAAAGGKDSLNAHWKGLDSNQRQIVTAIMDELKRAAIEADARKASAAGDTLLPDTPDVSEDRTPSAEEMERAMREAQEAAEAEARREAEGYESR